MGKKSLSDREMSQQLSSCLSEYCDLEGKCLAVLSYDESIIKACRSAASHSGISVLALNPEDLLHVQKRRLNEVKCEYIAYSGDCYEIVWELFNDGSTLLHTSLNIDEILK